MSLCEEDCGQPTGCYTNFSCTRSITANFVTSNFLWVAKVLLSLKFSCSPFAPVYFHKEYN